jgi:hypothetical protein
MGAGWGGGLVQIMYTHVIKCKNNTCWDCLGNRGRREDEKKQQRRWIQICIWYIVRTFTNTPMYPNPAQHKFLKKRWAREIGDWKVVERSRSVSVGEF